MSTENDVITKPDTEVITPPKTRVKIQVRPPSEYKVIYLNDEVTTMNFVVDSLVTVFDYTEDTAHGITEKIHADGFAIVAVLPYEIAEQKGIEVTVMARNNSFPLQVTLEPAD